MMINVVADQLIIFSSQIIEQKNKNKCISLCFFKQTYTQLSHHLMLSQIVSYPTLAHYNLDKLCIIHIIIFLEIAIMQKLQGQGSQQNQFLPRNHLSEAQIYLKNYYFWMSQYYYLLGSSIKPSTPKAVPLQVQQQQLPALIKQQEIINRQPSTRLQKQSKPINKTARKVTPKTRGKIKRKRREKDRDTEKNLLVHLKLWLQKYMDEKNKYYLGIRETFDKIFSEESDKQAKNVYMNLYYFEKLIKNQELKPFLKQFFENRFLRFLVSSNVKNKGCIVKYAPILLKKFYQERCKSLKS